MTLAFRELFSEEFHRLDNGDPLLISLIGAGGKTSTLMWLAQAFYRQGRRVLFTTTTKMYRPAASTYHHLWIGQPSSASNTPAITAWFSHYQPESNKVEGLNCQQIDEIKQQGEFDVILVEADGSRGLPLKAPARHEPCIPSNSDCVIALTGGQVVNRPANPQQIHRWAIFSELTGINAGDCLNQRVFSWLISHPQGMFKGTPPDARRIWLVNQFSHSDNQPDPAWHQVLRQDPLLSAIWLGSVQETPPIRHCLRRVAQQSF
ncbi:selenium cofactor biosynthesis protein YqeC [Serratia aquatilis]|uniref:Selenium cofactor biosynthesis protein YqeC n=1 Tax=Serratia aquatilis TaxID=1737515 RepID=A0ABV6E9B4_9GAMM